MHHREEMQLLSREDREMGAPPGAHLCSLHLPTYYFVILVWIALDHLCTEKSRTEPEKLLGSNRI